MTRTRRFAIPGSSIVLAFLLATTLPRAALAQNLVGYWPMEEITGATSIPDRSGTVPPNDGALTASPAFVAGWQGNALLLNGTTQAATVPDAASLDLTTGMTLAAWFKPAAAGTQSIIKKTVGSTTANGYELSLSANPVGSAKVFVRLNGSASFRIDSTTAYPTSGTVWMHAAATYDGTTIRLYINGVQEGGDKTGPVGGIATNTTNLGIGREPGATNWFNGTLDEVRVYNRALSAAEIAGLMVAPTPTPTSLPAEATNTPTITNTPANTPTVTNTPLPCDSGDGLVGLWGFEEASGVALDAAGTPNNATLLGAATRVAGGIDAKALSLPGAAGDWASVADDACLDISGNITLAAWVKPGRTTTTDLIDKAVNGTTDGYELGLSAAGAAADQKVFLRLNQKTSVDTFRVNSASKYPSDGCTWIHVAGTYDGANLRIYVNGSLENTVAGVTTIATNGLALGIGNQPDGAARSLLGQMDDVRVYNRALDGTEIAALAAAPPPPPCASPTNTPTETPTVTPTTVPTDTPTAVPTDTPTAMPTNTLTAVPTHTPTTVPTDTPTAVPTDTPTTVPTHTPTTVPTNTPTTVPTNTPTTVPTHTPTAVPTNTPPAGATNTPTATPNLVGYWPMEEGSGTSILDASGQGNDGTLPVSGTWVAGKRGTYAMRVDGSTQYASVPDAPSLNLTSKITLAAWIKPEQNTTQDLVKKATNGGINGYELTLSAVTAPNVQKVFVRFNQVTSGDTYRVNSTTQYPADGTTWMHVAATYDGTTIRLYVNGVQEGSLAASITIATNTLPLTIGGQSDGQRKYKGALDDVRVYGRALSAAEIGNLMVCGGNPDGASCDDSLFCNGADTCSSGACTHTGDPCSSGPECNKTCNETADNCLVVAGAPCTDDGDACTLDQCDGAGSCVHTPTCATRTPTSVPTHTPTTVPTHTPTVVPTTTPTAVPTHTPTGTPTVTPPVTATTTPTATSPPEFVACGSTPIPMESCRRPILPRRALVLLKTTSPHTRDKLLFQWRTGALTTFSAFGTPLDTTKTSLCVYDQNGLLVEVQVPAGGMCASGRRPCWKQTGLPSNPTGFRYTDNDLANDGAQRLKLGAGPDGRAKISVQAKGLNLGMPVALSVAPAVTVQVKNSNGQCWGALFSGPPIASSSELFKAKGE